MSTNIRNTEKRVKTIRENKHFIYLDIELQFESKDIKQDISCREFKLIIMSSIQSLFGDFGAKIAVDLIKYRERDVRAIVRTNAKDLVRVCNAFTLFSLWRQRVCVLRIHRICHTLSSLATEPFKPLITE